MMDLFGLVDLNIIKRYLLNHLTLKTRGAQSFINDALEPTTHHCIINQPGMQVVRCARPDKTLLSRYLTPQSHNIFQPNVTLLH